MRATPARLPLEDDDGGVISGEDGRPSAIVSAEPLPLRARRHAQGVHHRPEFPGTAVRIGDASYEVTDEQLGGDGRIVYALRPWPEHQLLRDQIVYGPGLLASVRAERERLERSRFLWPLYPLIGALPERWQLHLCDAWRLDPVRAARVSSLLEAACWFLMWRSMSFGWAVVLGPLAAGLIFMALLRALGAFVTREVSGSPIVVGVVKLGELLVGEIALRRDTTMPMARQEFWERLDVPDRQSRAADGGVWIEGALPHLAWTVGARVHGPSDVWRVEEEGVRVAAGRVTYAYRLVSQTVSDASSARRAEPSSLFTTVAFGDASKGPAEPPHPFLYREAVLAEVQREWQDLRGSGFGWLVSLLPRDAQARALAATGRPDSLRVSTLLSIAFALGTAIWMALAPTMLNSLTAAVLAADAGVRLCRVAAGQLAPSVLGGWLPRYLRPERLAFRAHRDAEREVLRRDLIMGQGGIR